MKRLSARQCIAGAIAWLVLGHAGLAAEAPSTAVPEGVKFRAFNASDFDLAYNAQLEAGNQERAFAIAQQAVKSAPTDRAWRLRLAQIAEWTQHPDVTAQQWRALFQMGDHSETTLDNVIKLGPLLGDAIAPLQAWAVKADAQQLNEKQWAAIKDLYEQQDVPAEGSVFFEHYYRQYQDPMLLETAAHLAEDAGDVGRTVLLAVERSVHAPLNVKWVKDTAASLIRWDCLEQARDLLLRIAPQVPENAIEFWNLLGPLAWNLRDTGTAEMAYRKKILSPQATAEDWGRLVQLVRRNHPQEAAPLAMQSYAQFGRLDDLLLALNIYASAADDTAMGLAFQTLRAPGLAEAESNSAFLQMRSAYYQRTQHPDLAWLDLGRAMRIDPSDDGAALSSLWFLVNQQRLGPLQQVMDAFRPRAQAQPDFWPAYAAGHQLLGHTQEALYWYGKQLEMTPEDALLLLTYADLLQSAGRAAEAASTRRHAWNLLQKKYAHQEDDLAMERPPELMALARLTLENSPGDPALRLVRQLVDTPTSTPLDRETALLVLGWTLGTGQYGNARTWMWRHFARLGNAQAPVWAQAQLALQFQDQNAMQGLLALPTQELPAENRYDIAFQLGHFEQALNTAYTTLESGKSQEAMVLRMRQYTPSYANYVQWGWSSEGLASQADANGQTGALGFQTLQAETRLTLTDHLQLTLTTAQTAITTDNPQFSSPQPDSDRLTQAQLRWLDNNSASTLALFERNALLEQWGVHLDYELRGEPRWDFQAGLDYGSPSTLSIPIRLGGYENDLHATLGYRFNQRQHLRISSRYSEYFSPQGTLWASGTTLDVEEDYRLKLAYPDWRVRLIASTRQLTANTTLGTFYVPINASTLTACVDLGSALMTNNSTAPYSVAWRPFMDTCMSQNDQGVGGWESGFGLVGSALGRDQLYIEFRKSEDTTAGNVTGQTLALRYRKYF